MEIFTSTVSLEMDRYLACMPAEVGVTSLSLSEKRWTLHDDNVTDHPTYPHVTLTDRKCLHIKDLLYVNPVVSNDIIASPFPT